MRTIVQWVEVIGNADATNEGDANAAARFILNSIIGQRNVSGGKVKELAKAMQAYAYLLQEAGVKVVL